MNIQLPCCPLFSLPNRQQELTRPSLVFTAACINDYEDARCCWTVKRRLASFITGPWMIWGEYLEAFMNNSHSVQFVRTVTPPQTIPELELLLGLRAAETRVKAVHQEMSFLQNWLNNAPPHTHTHPVINILTYTSTHTSRRRRSRNRVAV